MWMLGASSKKIYERIRSRYGTPAIGQGQHNAARSLSIRAWDKPKRGRWKKGNDKTTGVVAEHIFSISFFIRWSERERCREKVKPWTHSYTYMLFFSFILLLLLLLFLLLLHLLFACPNFNKNFSVTAFFLHLTNNEEAQYLSTLYFFLLPYHLEQFLFSTTWISRNGKFKFVVCYSPLKLNSTQTPPSPPPHTLT